MTALLAWLRGTSLLVRIGLGVAGVLAGVLTLRACSSPPAPARVEERKETTAELHQVEQTATEETRATVRRETRTETRPDGVQIVTVAEERTDAVEHQVVAAETTAAVHQVETRIVEAARPSWRATAAALWRPRDLTAAPPVLHGELLRRMVGPVWLGPAVQYDRQRHDLVAGVAVSIEW